MSLQLRLWNFCQTAKPLFAFLLFYSALAASYVAGINFLELSVMAVYGLSAAIGMVLILVLPGTFLTYKYVFGSISNEQREIFAYVYVAVTVLFMSGLISAIS